MYKIIRYWTIHLSLRIFPKSRDSAYRGSSSKSSSNKSDIKSNRLGRCNNANILNNKLDRVNRLGVHDPRNRNFFSAIVCIQHIFQLPRFDIVG